MAPLRHLFRTRISHTDSGPIWTVAAGVRNRPFANMWKPGDLRWSTAHAHRGVVPFDVARPICRAQTRCDPRGCDATLPKQRRWLPHW